jgi:hypothetical protein
MLQPGGFSRRSFLSTAAASLLAPRLNCIIRGDAPAQPERSGQHGGGPLNIGGMNQLFFDDRFIAASENVKIVMNPPVPLMARPLLEMANFITVGLLPRAIRRQYGFSWDPGRALALRGGMEYTRRALPLVPSRLRQVPSARSAA